MCVESKADVKIPFFRQPFGLSRYVFGNWLQATPITVTGPPLEKSSLHM
jgi:hypothetical protein